VALKKILEPFRPVPILVEKEGGRLVLEPVLADSIAGEGRSRGISSCWSAALAYILAYGPGVRQPYGRRVVENAITFVNIWKGRTNFLIPCPRCTKWCSSTRFKKKWR